MKKAATLNDLHFAVGEVVVAFAYLEDEIAIGLALVCDRSNPKIGRFVADKLQIKDSAELLLVLLSERLAESPEGASHLAAIEAELKQLVGFRNDVVHSAWLADLETGKGFTREPIRRRGGKLPLKFHDFSELQTIKTRIYALLAVMDGFFDEHLPGPAA